MSDEVDDRIDLGTAARLLAQGDPPMATCPTDGEPLIGTFEFRGAEFYCQVCHGKFGFLSPVPKDSTPGLQFGLAGHQLEYDAARAARQGDTP